MRIAELKPRHTASNIQVLSEYSFETGVVRLNYAVSGEPERPPLLLLHGATLNRRTFERVLPVLAERWHIYAMDLRGHGGSDWVPGGHRFVDYAEDVKAFLKGVVGEPALVLAHSYSGYFAIKAAADEPGLIRAMVLEDTPLFYRRVRLRETRWYDWFARVYSAISDASTAEELKAALAEVFPRLSSEAISSLGERLADVDPESLDAFLEHRHMEGYDLDSLLARVECPTLLLQADPALGAALEDVDAEHALSLLRHGSLVRVKGAGHMMHATHPGEVLRRLEGLVKERHGS